MSWSGRLYLEDEQQWFNLDEKSEKVDFLFKEKEIESGLGRKFYGIDKPDQILEDKSSYVSQQNLLLRFSSQPKPWFPLSLRDKLEKLNKGTIGRDELTDLIKKIAEISIDFYNIEAAHFIAVRFDGRVVEDADSQIELLLKVQGRNYGMPVFVWHVGYDSFLGWRT
jgi:hypothetical protein